MTKCTFVVRFAALILSTILLPGCVTTFQPYETDVNDFKGRGGTKRIVDGMEIWTNGEPPRRFMILGYLEDERPGGIIPMARLESDIVKSARQAGGDAVIEVSSRSEIRNFVTTSSASAYSSGRYATASGTAVTVPSRRNFAVFVVIRDLEDSADVPRLESRPAGSASVTTKSLGGARTMVRVELPAGGSRQSISLAALCAAAHSVQLGASRYFQIIAIDSSSPNDFVIVIEPMPAQVASGHQIHRDPSQPNVVELMSVIEAASVSDHCGDLGLRVRPAE